LPTVPEPPLDAEACRDLVLAIFRLAVCDLLGRRYGYDGPVSYQRLRTNRRSERRAAEAFLMSDWAGDLGDLAGFSVVGTRHEVQRRLDSPVEGFSWLARGG
jgi:hypothetical protein